MIRVIRIIHQNLQSYVMFQHLQEREERKSQRQQTKQTHNFLVSIVVFIRESYLFCDSCICRAMESPNQQQNHTCC